MATLFHSFLSSELLLDKFIDCNFIIYILLLALYHMSIIITSKEPVCPRVELLLKIIIILLIIFLGFIKSKPC